MAEGHRQGHAGRFLLLGKVRRRSVRTKRGPVNGSRKMVVADNWMGEGGRPQFK